MCELEVDKIVSTRRYSFYDYVCKARIGEADDIYLFEHDILNFVMLDMCR
jgi:hypothetical protein